ncbi:MAG: ABC transporter substrate-binding protein [Eubacteriales bacterium]|nr:ABC transporter substrate-binding protein [Clostridiales bacterium]MDD7774991.1 ABC transporter substrate-binding protein [Eubacteriales bacterium]MDY3940416.1 ABC transporter substrate-binding protein [Eubacteriales bacterium]
MKFKKSMTLILVASMLVGSLASCGSKTTNNAGSIDLDKYAGMDYDDASSAIYNDVLGEFYTEYQEAKEETNVSARYAKMALAEAKLLETAVMLPIYSKGGNYAVSRVAPYTIDYTLWGNDMERFHQALVATEFITSEDRAEMKAKWAELKGTGTYLDWAKEFLTGKGYTLKDTYTIAYSTDPTTWDTLATSRASDSEAIVNTYDGLMEYDVEGILQPALAESYTVSDDGLTYTFKIRSGATWVDSQGRKVADVTADDFVAGMQHMMDAMGGLEYLIEGVIVNASEYIGGTVTDFSQVGVKAVDDNTLEYTLVAPCSYFVTMLGYGVFAPMSRTYYESMGGKFGADYDPSAESYLYGKDSNSIAYCGPYLVTNATANSTIVFTANDSYWNKDNINIKTLTWLYNDGSEATKAYNDAVAGTIDGSGLNSSSLELAREDGNFDKYGYIASTDATSFMAFYNIYRSAYANVQDSTKVVSPLTEEQKSLAKAAMANVHFRRAISYAVDRGSYNAQSVGEDLKYTSLRNTYTPGNFVYLEEDVTVDVNGKSTTFKAGTAYGVILQAQLDADGIAIKAYDKNADDGAGSSDGYDGWYNVENAKAELEQAIKDLKDAGITVDASNPIYIDLPYFSASTRYTNMANAYKQSVESTLEGKVIVNLVACADADEWQNAGYYTENGAEANYHVYDLSGWGPDYGDPSTYLDTMLPDYAGYMTKCIGIF